MFVHCFTHVNGTLTNMVWASEKESTLRCDGQRTSNAELDLGISVIERWLRLEKSRLRLQPSQAILLG
jgi:hypothetical protein